MRNTSSRLYQKIMYRILIVWSTLLSVVTSIVSAQNSVDSLASPFILKDMKGNHRSLEELLGKEMTVIFFWATWGKDSSKILDAMQELYLKYQAKGLQVIGVCVEQQDITSSAQGKIADTLQKNQITFPVLLDQQLQTFHSYHIIAVPTTFVIDARRVILFKLSGYPIIGRGELKEFILARFEGKRPEPSKMSEGRKPHRNALLAYNMAWAGFCRGQIQSAKQHAVKASQLDSLFIRPRLLLAEIAFEEQNIDTAARYVDEALSIDPQSIEALSLRAFQLAKQGKIEQSMAILNSVLQQDSTAFLPQVYRGYAYGISGDLQRALSEFEKAELLSSSEYRIPLLRGEVYKHNGMLQEGLKELGKAKRLRKGRD